MRLATALLPFALALSAGPAHAGGIGLLTTGGVYSQRVAYYPLDDNGNPSAAPEFSRQGIVTAGSGLELMLGDRDDRIVGLARTWWNLETPESDPLDGASGIAAWRDSTRHVGSFSVGLQFGIVGAPDKAQLIVQGLVGSGFMTNDHSEFLLADLGAGGTIRFSRSVEMYGTANAHLRYRKGARGGGHAIIGLRYLFD